MAATLAVPGVALFGQDTEFGVPVIAGRFDAPTAIAVSTRLAAVLDSGRLLVSEVVPGERVGAAWAEVEVGEPVRAVAVDADERWYLATASALWVLDDLGDPASRRHLDPGGQGPDVEVADLAVGPADRLYALDGPRGRVLRLDGPEDPDWDLVFESPELVGARGLDVGPDGSIWVADTWGHRVVRPLAGGRSTEIGGYGPAAEHLVRPQDVAVGQDGLVYVADSGRRRVAVFDEDGSLRRSLGDASLLASAGAVAVDPDDRLWLADPGQGRVLVWPGPEVQAGARYRDLSFDGVLQPTGSEGVLGALLIQSAPRLAAGDLDEQDLTLLAEAIPAYGRDSFLYVQVENEGSEPILGGSVGAWVSRRDDPASFPEDWSNDPFFLGSPGAPVFTSFLEVGTVPAGGAVVLGPLGWRPGPEPDGVDCQSTADLMLRFVHLGEAGSAADRATVDASNNVMVRRVPLVPADCFPAPDPYETNDSLGQAAPVASDWEHLRERCPYEIVRGRGTYPEERCPGIFENYDAFGGGEIIPKAAEEIWRFELGGLSLHSPTDRDFLSFELPDTTSPRWGLDDITPKSLRPEPGQEDPTYRKVAMPECGAIRRRDPPGPGGSSGAVWLNLTTWLEVAAVAAQADHLEAGEPPDLSGESLRTYAGEALVAGQGTRLRRRFVCPRLRFDEGEVTVSFGERPPGSRRELADLGGYRLELRYVTSIERGLPDWASEYNDGRGVPSLGCLPDSSGPAAPSVPGSTVGTSGTSLLPLCTFGDLADLLRIAVDHPPFAAALPCIADGPGCLSLFRFNWPVAAPLVLRANTSQAGRIRVLDARRREVPRRWWLARLLRAIFGKQGRPLVPGRETEVRTDVLQPGDYYLEIRGRPLELELSLDLAGQAPMKTGPAP